jgi:hypothetical protein
MREPMRQSAIEKVQKSALRRRLQILELIVENVQHMCFDFQQNNVYNTISNRHTSVYHLVVEYNVYLIEALREATETTAHIEKRELPLLSPLVLRFLSHRSNARLALTTLGIRR